MRLKYAVLLLTFFMNCLTMYGQGGSYLFRNGTTGYKIFISEQAPGDIKSAAKSFQEHLQRVSGASFDIAASKVLSPNLVLLTSTTPNTDPGLLNSTRLTNEGFVISIKKTVIAISGITPRGTLFGINTFLEKYLGCRTYGYQLHTEKKLSTLPYPKDMTGVENPAFNDRIDYYFESFRDKDYVFWNKLTLPPPYYWGLWVHSFGELLPSDRYFKDHPEYFAMKNGQRQPHQLCLTNPQVYNIILAELKSRIAKNPGAIYWSVSQNDTYHESCECPNCSKVNDYEGSAQGTLLTFVNRIAANFPDKKISTLAYANTQKPPLHVVPAKNVYIMLCVDYHGNRRLPIAKDPLEADFVKDLQGWKKITGNLMVWDYVTRFLSFLSPFPNLYTLQDNIQFFRSQGIPFVFSQGNAITQNGEFGVVRGYLIAKLLWNPNENFDELLDDVLNGYYGKAGPYIKGYITLMNKASEKANLNIYSNATDDGKTTYLTPKMIAAYTDKFDQAESAVRNNPDLLERVQIARLPLTYVILELSKSAGTLVIKSNMKAQTSGNASLLLKDFVAKCKKAGVLYLDDRGTTPDDYLKKNKAILH